MKVRDLIRELLADGWVKTSQEGSHAHYEHPTKPQKVTVPFRPGDEIPAWYAERLRRQAGLR